MLDQSTTERTHTPDSAAGRNHDGDYWLVCGSCFWKETACSSKTGMQWPSEVNVEQGRLFHKRCGGALKVFKA